MTPSLFLMLRIKYNFLKSQLFSTWTILDYIKKSWDFKNNIYYFTKIFIVFEIAFFLKIGFPCSISFASKFL